LPGWTVTSVTWFVLQVIRLAAAALSLFFTGAPVSIADFVFQAFPSSPPWSS
jgi:hypothetical protein